ncbi:MAG: hypothetical protein KAS07_00055 [Candidatus Pacebacteria bacterium]|nr:hypothetical protein [Candidatus Paceibacterota bacterium]
MQIQTLREFDDHEKVVRLHDPSIGLKGFIAIHKRRGDDPCLGATRLWRYASEEDALNDALRLSRLMTRKSALANLPYGGAKAVLMETPELVANREKVFTLYARVVEKLDGLFVTGSDVGVFDEDLQIMKKNSRYIIGANVPAGYYTALGVMEGIRAVLEELYGSSNMEERSFAIQGLGKTGFELFKLLSKDAKTIVVADINKDTITKVKSMRPDVKVVHPSEIHTQKVDIFCPCALSHSVNRKTLPEFSCKAVVGSANNQLEDDKGGALLHERGILYTPDYVVNSGGLISVVDQFKHSEHNDLRITGSLDPIYENVRKILAESRKNNLPPECVAETIAQKVINDAEREKSKSTLLDFRTEELVSNSIPVVSGCIRERFFKEEYNIEEILHLLKTKPAVYWEKKGKEMTLNLFRFTARSVFAYSDLLRKHNVQERDITHVKDFDKLPYVDKHTYVKAYKRKELLPYSDVSSITTFSSTSGSTGEPTYFPRGEEQDWQYEHIAELFLRNQFDIHNKKTLGIIGFALGIWIGGVFTYKNFNTIAKKGYPLALAPVGTNKDIFLKTLKELGDDFEQIILMGYPPFIKDVIDEAPDYGIDLGNHNIKILTATESFSEQFRDYIARKAKIKNKYRDIINIYGTVELGTMAHETALTNLIRDMAVKDKRVYNALFPDVERLPTLAQFYPHITYFENIGEELYASGFGSLFPFIRYRLYDKGGIISFNDMLSKMKSTGVDILKEAERCGVADTVFKLPFVYVHERSDFVVILRGANIYPENIRAGLMDRKLEKMVTGKFTMTKKEDKNSDEYLEINVELKKDVAGNKYLENDVKNIIVETLREKNSEYNNSYLAEGRKMLPKILFYSYENPMYFSSGIKQKWVVQN